MSSIEDIRIKFPKELEDLLEFEEYPETITLRGKRFLETSDFTKVGAIVRSLGGEYVSLGKQSHFKVPRHQQERAQLTLKGKVRMAIDILTDIEKQLEKK